MNTIAKTRSATEDDITAQVLRRLDTDTVFAVKDSLICTFQRHDVRDEDAERFELEPPFCTAEFDFVLKPNRRQE